MWSSRSYPRIWRTSPIEPSNPRPGRRHSLRGPEFWCARRTLRRSRLQYRHHRLSGNLHRSFLFRPDRRSHQSANRQLRRERLRQRSRQALHRRPGRPRILAARQQLALRRNAPSSFLANSRHSRRFPNSTPARWSAICAAAASCAACSSADRQAIPKQLVEKARNDLPPWPGSIWPPASPPPAAYEWTARVEPCSPSDTIGAAAEPAITWSPTISASSATSCAAWSTPAAA